MDRPKFVDHPEPTVVLRGGPLDGHRTHVHPFTPLDIPIDGGRCFYRPAGELDTEYPTLYVLVFDHTEPAQELRL